MFILLLFEFKITNLSYNYYSYGTELVVLQIYFFSLYYIIGEVEIIKLLMFSLCAENIHFLLVMYRIQINSLNGGKILYPWFKHLDLFTISLILKKMFSMLLFSGHVLSIGMAPVCVKMHLRKWFKRLDHWQNLPFVFSLQVTSQKC